MKYKNIYVLIPWYDKGMKNWMHMHFQGTFDSRRLKREVRKYIQKAFHKTVDKDFLKHDVLYVKQFDPEVQSPETLQRGIEALRSLLQDEHEEIEQTRANQETQTPVT